MGAGVHKGGATLGVGTVHSLGCFCCVVLMHTWHARDKTHAYTESIPTHAITQVS